MPRKELERTLVITSTDVSRETRRRTSRDWFSLEQICTESMGKILMITSTTMCERDEEEPAETGSTRNKFATEGTRGRISDY